MLASNGEFPIPLPYGVTQHILSFIPPKWTRVTRETIVPPDAYLKMVLADSRYKFKFARFYLLTPGYGFQTLKRGAINFATCESELFLKFRNRPVPDEITIGDIFPENKTSQAIDDLMRFNYDMLMLKYFDI